MYNYVNTVHSNIYTCTLSCKYTPFCEWAMVRVQFKAILQHIHIIIISRPVNQTQAIHLRVGGWWFRPGSWAHFNRSEQAWVKGGQAQCWLGCHRTGWGKTRKVFAAPWKLTLSGCINNICIIIKVPFSIGMQNERMDRVVVGGDIQSCNYYYTDTTLSRVIIIIIISFLLLMMMRMIIMLWKIEII